LQQVVTSFLATTLLAFILVFTILFLDQSETIINGFRQWVLCSQRVYTPSPSPVFWSKVLGRMLLACSDIQIITALGIQVVALMRGCEMSMYHFQIVADLAWLSSVTHVVTVAALRDCFVKERWGSAPRVCLMLGNLGLVGYTSFVAYSYDVADSDLSMSLPCFFKVNPKLNATLLGRWAALMVGAIGTHFSIILAMFFLSSPKDDEKRKKVLWKFGAGIRTWFVAPIYSIYGIYMAGIGLRHTQALGAPNVRIQGSETEWGFGQLLPLLLLVLPLFAGWEAFWQENKNDGEAKTKIKNRKKENRIEKGMIGSPIPKTSQDSSSSFEKGGSSVEDTSPIYTPYSISPSSDPSEEERRTESNGSSPEMLVPKTYHLSAFKDSRDTWHGRPGTIVEVEEAQSIEPQFVHTARQRSSTSRRSMHFSYPNRAPPRSSQGRLSQARLSQYQKKDDGEAQPVLCGHCEVLPRESLYLGGDRGSRRSSYRRSQMVRASYVPL
jgi:hypothetical protein